MKRCIFFQVYPADLTQLKKCRHDLADVATRLKWPKHILSALQLCVSELIANTANYSSAPKATQFSLTLLYTREHLLCEYSDNGGPFNPLAQPTTALNTIDIMAEHGRGLSLLEHYCQHLEYQAQAGPFVNNLSYALAWPQTTHQHCVLLVEDNPAQNHLYREFLHHQYQVIACLSAQEALDALQTHTVDIVVSDIAMPGINGIDLRKTLLAQHTTALIPFIFLTGSEDSQTEQRLAHLGIDDFLQKPVSKTELVNSIERVVLRSQQLLAHLSERLDTHITQALQPKLPTHCLHWHLTHASRNTGKGGGDAVFLEATPNPTLVLIDVMGHDITAKFFAHAHTGYLRGLVRSMVPRGEQPTPVDPAVILNHLSAMAYADDLLNHTMLTTLVIELLPKGEVRFASAGHPPPIITSAQGLKRLPTGGMLPGLIPDSRYSNSTVHLQPGERLALFSDGLFEGASDPTQRAVLEQTMLLALAQSATMPLAKAQEHVMQLFDSTAGNASDDVTLLLLEPAPLAIKA